MNSQNMQNGRRRDRMANDKKLKKEILKDSLYEFIDSVLDIADSQDRLDYMKIEISNHNGNLQTDYTLRDREKAY